MSARRNLRLLGLGIQAELRNPGFRLLGVVTALMAGLYAWNQGDLAASTAVTLSSWLSRGFGLAAALWFAYAAVRDQNARLGAVIRAKPIDGAYWVALTWASGLLVWLLLLALAFLAAALGQFPAAGVSSLAAHSLGFFRAATVLLAVSTLSFALSRMMRTPVGGILVAFAWFCVMAGLDLVPPYLRPDYSQNALLYVLAAAFFLFLTGFLVERLRRGELRRPLPVIAGSLVLLLAAGGAALGAYHSDPEQQYKSSVLWTSIESQDLQKGERVPGFWLPDGRGGRVSTAAFPGKILVIYLFPGPETEAARTLQGLNEIAREFGDQNVQPIGICLSQDQGHGPGLTWTGGYRYPIGFDPTTRSVSPQAASALAVAFRAQTLPLLVITDRQRRVRYVGNAANYDIQELRRKVQEQLQ